MIRRRFSLVVLLALVLFSAPLDGYAARYSADYLMQMCAMDAQGQELVKGGHIACQGYIAGVMDYHTLIRSLGTSPSVDFCIPEGITLSHIHRVVLSYLVKNKHEQGPFIAAPGVALALYQAFPCMERVKK